MALVALDLFKGEINKVPLAIERLRTFEPEEGYYLAFSGGKDSQVIYHLALEADVKFDAHFNVTTVDPPELLRFIKEHYPQVERHRPPKSMWKLMEERSIPPTRWARYCCQELKENGGKGRFVVTGIRAAESSKRSQRRMIESCYRDRTRHYVNPIIDWTEHDVWSYIRGRGLPYCQLYDEGFRRIGCVGCPMGGPAQIRAQFERWPNFKRAYHKAFGRMLAARTSQDKYGDWKTPEDVMAWFLGKGPRKGDPDQTVMFE